MTDQPLHDEATLAFYDRESGLVRIAEVNSSPVRDIEGPPCVGREGAEVTARPLDDGSGDITVSVVGTPPQIH